MYNVYHINSSYSLVSRSPSPSICTIMDLSSPSPSSTSHFKQMGAGTTWRHTLLLSFQSLGVVYGRLSVAPLYVLGILEAGEIKSEEFLYGLLSFIFWTITIIPLVKYTLIVLKADDNGEGGTFALYSLLCRHAKVGLLPNHDNNEIPNYETTDTSSYNAAKTKSTNKMDSRAKRAIEKHKSSHYLMLFLALFGACMAIGDGVLTPAISVLSTSSGLQQSLSEIPLHLFSSTRTQHKASEAFKKYMPISSASAILICLFALQHYGSHKIGFIFAPIIIVWLLLISGVGVYNIIYWNPHILYAISPEYIYKFVKDADFKSWRALGSVLLCIAGSETMFTDLGHFSKKSTQISFILFIYPAIILSYAGQAAYISQNTIHGGTFKNHKQANVTNLSDSIPKCLHHAFTVLSLLATAVGSQATITATFSIIKQCLALDCFPRVKVIHTSDKIHGQVYIPDINWILMLLCLGVTIGFGHIRPIGSATGLAVISGMLVTTCLMSLVIALYWEKNLFISACFLMFFGSIEVMYLVACLLRFHKGAWFLLFLLVITMTCMLAWHYGTMKKYEFDMNNKVSMDWLTGLSSALGVTRVPGIGFIYSDIVSGIPAFFSHFVTNLPAFHQVVIFVSFKSVPVPCVPPSRRYLIGRVGPKDYRVYRCIVRYGYCDRVRDSDDFEDKLISSIGDFISMEETDTEAMVSPEGKLIAVGGRNALIPVDDSKPSVPSHSGSPRTELSNTPQTVKRKKVRFLLSPDRKATMRASVKEELQELVDARDSGTAYFLGQSHLYVRRGSNPLKQFMIMIYLFLDKNCREPPVALNIPHAALVEVGMVYNV